MEFKISGNIVDIINKRIFPGSLDISGGIIKKITEDSESYDHYIMPGFIDAHIHIESSMLIPSEFARLVVIHGTVATVSDPHEIANVCGIEGVRYMIKNGNQVPFKFYFGAPSCVPATSFETSGYRITADDIRTLFKKDELKYLSEMMNYPGVLYDDKEVIEKLSIAKKNNKPIDGHAPGLRGNDAQKYISAGITTDHECFSYEEAHEKVKLGMKILIREGSAAKNFDELHPLIKQYPEMVMFCSDDKHPNELVRGHIDEIVKRAINAGHDIFDVLRCASLNASNHYGLETGCLRINDSADFIVVNDLKELRVLKTFIDGRLVAKESETLIERVNAELINNFNIQKKKPEDFVILSDDSFADDGVPVISRVKVIDALDGQLITEQSILHPTILNGRIESDITRDILKICVVNRYKEMKPAVALIRNFGLKKGALASSIAHDSHNIIAVGVTDKDICDAVNIIIENKGGISAADNGDVNILPLPVAGIMTNDNGFIIGNEYTKLDAIAKSFGTTMNSPFMTLSFMALLVIPSLKISDKGLFDANAFSFTDIFVK